ncbi:GAF domain-containing sensor histidine kinase [Cesiribacter sp. SM1]|uniref:GAF domain-containing sensor histidine kinase n=1 Tax=Cesiribacter sp. SM1 TaxID=2861196 RepID=UPI001CD332D2|nr:GAF domain-containing sensor histidine kinase [Cesiribacter sp. SM1]
MSEKERLNALYNYAVLDTEQEAEFNNIVQLASQICNTPVSLITLLDSNRQWFKARVGVDIPETHRNISFCTHAIEEHGIMVVPDATKDERFVNNPLVTGFPFIKFYAGAPLVTPAGYALGTLCVIDQQTRELTQEQLFALQTLSQQVVSQLELRQKVRQLNAIVETKNKILSVISHDVKGPLNNIKQLLSLFLADDVPLEDMKMLSAEIQNRIDKADYLLSDLLNWFQSQVDDGAGKFEEVKLAALVDELLVENSVQLQQKNNVALNTIHPAFTIVADVNMMRFVLRNLLVNACKFTSGGLITISAQKDDDGVQISVKDTGTGIEAKRLDNLFTWNKLKSTAGTQNEKGHGLGLLLSQDFVRKHQGCIEILSEAGIGTEVKVVLPLLEKKVIPEPNLLQTEPMIK